MASSSHDKKKFVDHPPRDGLTGMSLHTRRHFDDVKYRMEHYVGEQGAVEYDGSQQHKKPGLLDRIFGDGQAKGLTPPQERREKSGDRRGHTPDMERRHGEHHTPSSTRTSLENHTPKSTHRSVEHHSGPSTPTSHHSRHHSHKHETH